ncbi:hypothetical protein [Limosilactobacillus reuteri]|uniref:hypothetical protein n=1 Tax=Limosilactobacillus reuteri TaxID=1598 RepID=UPI0015DFE89B|nr:hypothetical protein [Limosilactobacillus reuteri]QLL75901.1 hypothetical protein GTO86_04650 [Limosilactobacillus reuteri]
MKELHTDDLSMNSGKLFREQMVENFKTIEQTINDIRKELSAIAKRQDELEKELHQQRQRIDRLERKHDDFVKNVDERFSEMDQRLIRIEKLLFGAELINRTDDDEPSEVQPDSYLVNDTDTVNDDNGIIESNLIN